MLSSDLAFDPSRHVYTFRGRTVPSVTQVLAAITNFDGIPQGVLESARRFGQHVHKAVDLFNKGELDEELLDESLRPYLDGWKLFLSQTQFQVTHSEERVYNARFKYAGTLDARGRWKKTTWLLDLKSGAVPRSVGAQTAAYQMALEEKPRRRLCVQLKPNDYRLITCDEATDFALFHSCLNIWNFLNDKHADRILDDTYA